MVIWSRLRQSKHKFHLLTNEFRRCYTMHHGPIVASEPISSHSLFRLVNSSDFTVHGTQFENFQKVRFFAAPVQAVQKKNERDTSGHRLNEQITAPTIRLVTDEDHYVISRHEALARAKSLKLDLVEVDSGSKPPVCKIFDYHKEKYVRQVKEKERAKSKTKLKSGAFKEVRFASKISKNDLQMKADMVKRLMESGHRVKCTAIDPTDKMDLQTLLSRFSALIEDIAVEESGPQIEKKQAYIIVRHVKFGPAKSKGSKKKASDTSVSSQSDKNQSSEEKEEPRETGSEGEQEWAVFDGDDDDINAVFDCENGQPKSPKHDKSSDPTGSPVDLQVPSQHIEIRHNIPSSSSTPLGVVPNSPTVNRYARDSRAGKASTDMNGPSSPLGVVPNNSTVNRYARDSRAGKPPIDMNAPSTPLGVVPNNPTVNRYARDPRAGKPPTEMNVPSTPFGVVPNNPTVNRYARDPRAGKPPTDTNAPSTPLGVVPNNPAVNRYARDPRAGKPPTDMNAPSTPLGVQSHPTVNRYARDPRAGRPPTDMNSPSTPLGVPSHPTVNRYSRDPRAGNPPTNMNARFDPNLEKQQSQFSNNRSPQMTKTFGIFNPPKANISNTTPGEQNPSAGINRYKKSDPASDSTRSP